MKITVAPVKSTRIKSISQLRPISQTKQRLTLIALSILSTFLVASPALSSEVSENVSRLILTNACMSCNLAGADLSEAHLIGADLREANLQGTDLTSANLEGADFTHANLTGANLTGAFLTNAVMNNAQLNQVNFTEAHLYYVQIDGASVENIILTNAQVLHTPLSVGGAAPTKPNEQLPQKSPQKPVVDPQTFQQSNTDFPSDLLLLSEDDLIDLPAPLMPEWL